MKTFLDHGIDVQGKSGVQIKTHCPKCSDGRKNKRDKSLSVNTVQELWNCHHCGWKGALKSSVPSTALNQRQYARPAFKNDKPRDQLIEWFSARKIPKEIVERNHVKLEKEYIVFPYYRNDEVINLKYRKIDRKAFHQFKGAEKILYGLDSIIGHSWAVIVEGEIDCLSLQAAGIPNCVSVPDGAPPETSNPTEKKFEYLVNCEKELGNLSKIILAVDGDGPGTKLEAELVNRLGPERCWRVEWPQDCKDANDVLQIHGVEDLALLIDRARPYPLESVVQVCDVAEEVHDLYQNGWSGGVSTGWNHVDKNYTVRLGEFTVVTGIPTHGKSEWLDALAVNLAREHGWTIAFYSPENWPIEVHVAKLIEKFSGYAFSKGYKPRLPQSELTPCIQWLDKHFVFLGPYEERMTIDLALSRAKQAVDRHGIQGLILDPWNELDHSRPENVSETEYVSLCLTKIRQFIRKYRLHVWVVAHPTKLQCQEDGTYPVPTPYSISGSAHWRNKPDNCLTVWRDELDKKHIVELHVQKVRFRQVGTCGKVDFRWNPLNGRYS